MGGKPRMVPPLFKEENVAIFVYSEYQVLYREVSCDRHLDTVHALLGLTLRRWRSDHIHTCCAISAGP